MEKRNALIAGATGLVGSSLITQLLADDQFDKIVILVRKPIAIQHPKLIQKQIDFETIELMKLDFQVDDVFCALGTTIKTSGSQDAFYKVDYTYVVNLGKWCVANNVKRLLIVSAMGASAKSGIFYNRVKGEMETAVSQLNIPQIQVFRPSLLMGNRTEKRGGEKIAQVVMGTLGFLFAGPLLKYKGIHADVVAKAMITAAREDRKGFTVFESGEMQGMGK
ncbi:MAG: oxidoreductase [Bacteroidales bacterium]|nr:oxidoreductase [Bacteroidales bacterium]